MLLADLIPMAVTAKLAPAHITTFRAGRPALEYSRAERPNLVIVDLGLPDMDGRTLIRALHKLSPNSRVIVLTGQVSPTLPRELLALGVTGYIDKTSPLENIENAIRRVLSGGIYFAAELGMLGNARPVLATPADQNEVAPEHLTPREREIARCVAAGMISKEIARNLGLSPRTIEKARAQLQEKLGVRDLPSLVRWCVKHGL